MPTEWTGELTQRFGCDVADAIFQAYEAAITVSTDSSTVLHLTPAQRLQLVEIVIAEVEAGMTDREHLKRVALVYVSQQLRAAG